MAARIHPKAIDPVRTARLRGWVEQGHTSSEIARLEGVARSTMTEVLQRHGLSTIKRGFAMNQVTRPGSAPVITAAQRIRIGQLIAAGHSNDLVIAQHTGATPEQVDAVRRQGQAQPPSRKKPR